MSTPTFLGATSGQSPQASQVNQLLATHPTTYVYNGAQKDHQATAGSGSTASNGTWVAQSFTAGSSYTSGRVSLTFAVTGSPAPLVITLRPDNSGAPSATVLATVTVPNSFVPGSPITVSMPLSASITSGSVYWIVAQAVGDVSNFYSWSKSNQVAGTSTSGNGTSWTAQAYGSLFKVWDTSTIPPLVHTWEDSGARWTTLMTATGGQLNTVNEYTTAQNGSYVQSSASYAYTSGQLTGITQGAANNGPQPWSAARSGLLGDTGAVNASAEVNQFLGAHNETLIYQGNAIVTPDGTGGGINALTLNGYDLDQPFTMSGTVLGRVIVPLLLAGSGSDLIVSLCNDSGGNPGSVITQTRIPAAWIEQVAAVTTLGFTSAGSTGILPQLVVQSAPTYTNNPLATAQFNRFFMGFTTTKSWPYPTSGTGGPASGPISTYFGNYFIQLGGTNGGTTFYSDVYTIPYDTAGTLSAAVPQPQLPVPHDGSGAAVVSMDPSGGACTLVLTGGSQVSGSYVNSVYTANFNPATGGIDSWSTQTNMPVTAQFHMMAAWNGYVYVIGGSQNGVGDSATVYYAQVQNGQIAAWTQTSSLPLGSGFAFAAACNGFVFTVGGFISSSISNVFYAPVNSDGSLGAWLAGPPLPAASSALDALPCMVADKYGIMINASGHLMTLAVTANGPDIAWQEQNVPSGGNFFALEPVQNGTWRYYGILGTTPGSYITMDVNLMTCVSVPLPTTGLTNSALYHILMQSPTNDLNNYIALGADFGTTALPGNPKFRSRPKGQSAWTASTNSTIPIAVYDQTVTGTVWHTWEDGGARISTLAYATTPDQRLVGILEGVEQPGPVMNQNPTFTPGTAPWVVNGGALAQSNTHVQGGLPFSAQLTPNGIAAVAFLESEQEPVFQNHSYTPSMRMYSAVGYTGAFININWYDGTHAFLSSSGVGGVTLPAGVWTHLTTTVSPPTNAVYATLALGESGTPPASAVVWISAATLQDASGPMLGTVTEVNWSGKWPSQVYPPLGMTQLA